MQAKDHQVSLWPDRDVQVDEKVSAVSLDNTFNHDSKTSQNQNIGFPIETSGFESTLYFKRFLLIKVYIHVYIFWISAISAGL